MRSPDGGAPKRRHGASGLGFSLSLDKWSVGLRILGLGLWRFRFQGFGVPIAFMTTSNESRTTWMMLLMIMMMSVRKS